jgi:hypothetical protein
MALAVHQFSVVDDNGDVVPNASIEVRQEITGSPIAVLFSDRAGVVSLGNPFNADADGFAQFFVAGGAYRVTATSGALTRVWRYVAVGTAAEADAESFMPAGPITVEDYIDFPEIAAPANPGTNTARMYAVDDGAGVTTLTMRDNASNVVPLSHFTQAGTGAVSRTQLAKMRDIVSVEDFGAVGDGTTDDSAAIDAAIEYLKSIRGGILYFGPKRYAVASNPGIRIDGSGIHLMGTSGGYVFGGAQNKGTEILYTGANGGQAVYMAPASGLQAACSISNMSILCNSLALTGLYVGTLQDYLIDNIDIEGYDNASMICAYFTDNIAAGSVFNYRGTIRRLVCNAPGAANGIFLDGANPDTGGRHPAFLSFYDCHVTHDDGVGFFLRSCDDCHFFNCACSLTPGGTGNSIYFYSSNTTELRAANGNSFYGFNSGGNIFVDPGNGTPYQARGNKVFLTSIDHQITITDAAHILWVEDWGSYDATIIPYSIMPRAILHREDAVNNGVSEVLRLRHHTTGTPATGIGGRIAFEVETAADNYEDGAYIDAVSTDVTGGAENFDLVFRAMRLGAAPAELGRWNSHGGLRATRPGAGGLAGIGYGTGAGGTVTQATNKSTAVTLNTLSGQITMNAEALANATSVNFTVNNTAFDNTRDTVIAHHAAVGGAYEVKVLIGGTNSFRLRVTNVSGGSLSEAIVINFNIIKGASA